MLQTPEGTLRDLEALSALMDERQGRVFQIFVALGSDRSLPQLHKACHQAGIQVSEIMLKRWSAKFRWFDLALRTQAEISRRLANEMLPKQVEYCKRDLEIIQTLKGRFYTRVDLDPSDPKLTEAQVRRAIDVDLQDFLRLLDAEKKIVGRLPTDPPPPGPVDEPEKKLPLADAMIARIIQTATEEKYGLPPAALQEPKDAE
jgi:hypothetical protein